MRVAREWVAKAPLERTMQITGVVVAIVGVSLFIYFMSTTPRATDFSPHFRRPLKNGIRQGVWGAEEARNYGLSKEWNAYSAAHNKAVPPALISYMGGLIGGAAIVGLGLGLEQEKMKGEWKAVQARLEEGIAE